MNIREAKVDDAEGACAVLRRSIVELCHLDHHGDAELIQQWLANKTPDNVRAWITARDNHVFVACADEIIVGVAAITNSGYVSLNYVAPESRFRGVSNSLLAGLEDEARKLGAKSCRLTSTETAYAFYQSAGYIENDASGHGTEAASGHLMTKRI